MARYWIIVLGVFIFDQWVKWIPIHNGGQIVCNTGVAFGFVLPWQDVVLGILFLVGMIGWWKFYSRRALVWNIGGIMVLSGAFSNIIDRVVWGCVVDVFQPVVWFPAFNVADIAIVSGVMLLVWFEWRQSH